MKPFMEPAPASSGKHFPERVGAYEVLLPIASGGMATVYLARARGLAGFERDVALKLTHQHLRELPEFVVDLVNEAKLAVRVRHANVVPVLDVGDDPFGVFLVMEYIEGDSLSGLTRRAKPEAVPIEIAARVLLDALAGLHAAHELRDGTGALLGVVHRDFSPQNILVGIDGVSRLTDFGIAKVASRHGQTKSGHIKGKPSYMAPEQAHGRPVDRRCDVWAAGVIAWEIFAHRRLYFGDDELAVLLEITSEDAPSLRTVIPETHPAIDEAITCALARDPAARPPNAQSFASSLAAACGAAGVRIAEHAEVARWVERLAGPKLQDRRARASAIVEQRSRRSLATSNGGASSVSGERAIGLAMNRASEQRPGETFEATAGDASASQQKAAAPAWLVGVATIVVAAAAGASVFAMTRRASVHEGRSEPVAASAQAPSPAGPPSVVDPEPAETVAASAAVETAAPTAAEAASASSKPAARRRASAERPAKAAPTASAQPTASILDNMH